MVNLYKHIENLGKKNGYKNMSRLCAAAGVPRTTMSELNKGRSKDLSKPNAQKFANLLGVSLDDIYGVEEKEKPATISDDGLAEINSIFLSLDPDNRAKLLELAHLYFASQHKNEEKQ